MRGALSAALVSPPNAPKDFFVTAPAPTEIAPGVLRFEKVEPSGWCFNMFVVKLPCEKLLVHSPTWLGDETFAAIDALGEVAVLLAPNSYHHLSLGRFRARYTSALAVAAKDALPRLAKKGHDRLEEVEAADALMPPGAAWLRCAGTKSGEVWLSVPARDGPTWLACDAFFHIQRAVTGLTGIALRALKVTPGLRISTTYSLLALRDPRAYRAWCLDAIVRGRPRRLLVSHGEAVDDPALPETLKAAVETRFADR
jgi:hypothetical protein